MPFTNGCIRFKEFFKNAYDAATVEPFASRFNESSTNGDREGMIKVLLDIAWVGNLRVGESYTCKDDVKASELYNECREVIAENGADMHEKERRISILSEALFAANANSRLFLDVLVDCARFSYDSKAFLKSLKYCDYMLALPANLYDKAADFLERRKACVCLQQECSKMLKASSQGKKSRRKGNSNQTSDDTLLLTNPSVTIPTVDGKRHATLQSCSDAVTLQFDEKRGRHLVASRNIKAGSVLIVEKPFAFSTNQDALDRNCLHCHISLRLIDSVKLPCRSCQTACFCSEKCRREAWETYHRYECPVLNSFYENDSKEMQQRAARLLLAYRITVVGSLSSSGKQTNSNDEEEKVPFLNDNFLGYHTADGNIEYRKLGINEVYNPRDYRTVFELETHCTSMEPSLNLIRAIEAINCNAYEIVENVYEEKTHVWEPRHVGSAIYPSVSLVNHGCYPNVVRHSYPSGMVVVRTLRFVGKGSEILDCYGPHFLTDGRLARREYLWKKFRFLCACEACTQNWQYPLPETMNYKCRACSEVIGAFPFNDKDAQNASVKQCSKCNEKNDCRKTKNQFRKSVEKRLNAISKMYKGHHTEALPQLLEHIHFIEKFFAVPNIETIKTQQCIIQCYNQFGCTSQ